MCDSEIIFFDDDVSILKALKRYFRKTEFQCHYFSQADEVLSQVHAQRPVLLISDLNMPGITIENFLTDFMMETPESQIIILSGNPDPEKVKKLVKQFPIRKVLEKSDRIIQNIQWEISQFLEKSPIIIDKDIEELIPGFLNERIEQCHIALQELKKGNYDEVGSIGHNLKGAGGLYGFDFISHCGEEIENSVQSGNYRDLSAKFHELIEYLRSVIYIFR